MPLDVFTGERLQQVCTDFINPFALTTLVLSEHLNDVRFMLF